MEKSDQGATHRHPLLRPAALADLGNIQKPKFLARESVVQKKFPRAQLRIIKVSLAGSGGSQCRSRLV